MRARAGGFFGVAVICGLMAGLAGQASAKTFDVTRGNDPNPGACKPHDCSLREAVDAANKHKGTDTVLLESGHTYILRRSGRHADEGSIDISHSLVVRASGGGRATIDGKRVDGIFDAELPGYHPARSVKRGEGSGNRGHVKLKDLVLKHGRARFGAAGAIFCSGKLILDHVSINHNDSATGLAAGIMAYNGLTMKHSSLTNNDGAGANWGGGTAAGKVRISHSSIAGNFGESVGGISVGGSTRIDHSAIVSNKAGNTGSPTGGIYAQGAVNLSRSTVSRNRGNTGGIDASGKLIVNRSTLDHNKGGAIVALSRATIKHSKIRNNSGPGGAAVLAQSHSLTVSDSTLSGNSAIFQGGAIGIFYSTITPRAAGRDTADRRASAPLLTVTGSTIDGNSAQRGGGIQVDGARAKITNTTVSGNEAEFFGGGINLEGGGTVVLNATSVVRNTAGPTEAPALTEGGGLRNNMGGTFDIENSLVALNKVVGGNGPDCYGQFTSQGHNYLTHNADCLGFGSTDQVSALPLKLGQLADNGGPTKTVALKKGSPAIGKANKQSSPKRDQRGHKRGKHPDVGAFER